MGMTVRKYREADVPQMTELWNHIVEEADSFPQDRTFSVGEAGGFFASQSFSGVAEEGGRILGLYILHPNNVGRCAHTANASYGVAPGTRGKGIGERLVRHSLETCRELGFLGLQFNAVVCTNTAAIRLYERLGFDRIGTTKNGYRLGDGSYADLYLFHKQIAPRE